MEHRLIQFLIVVFWLAAMTWLTATKILPHANSMGAPDQRLIDRAKLDTPKEVRWNMYWDDRAIGSAEMNFVYEQDGISIVRSVVHCSKLPVSEMASELLGNWSVITGIAGLGGNNATVSFDFETEMLFDVSGKMNRFQSTVKYPGIGELFVLRGFQYEDKLDVAVTTGAIMSQGREESNELFRRTFPLPADALVIDAFAPSPRLANLRPGQEWTFRTFRPFPPNAPLRTAKAVVEGRDMLAWEGEVASVYVVSFAEVDSGLTSIDKPFSKLWVRDDGVVLKQQLSLANLNVEFRRQGVDETEIQVD
jgi:hypothetical protein